MQRLFVTKQLDMRIISALRIPTSIHRNQRVHRTACATLLVCRLPSRDHIHSLQVVG